MSCRKLLACFIAGSLSISMASACGPDFPSQLLDDRANTLKTAQANSFAYEASHLVQASDSLQPVETDYKYGRYDDEPDEREKNLTDAEDSGLTKAEADMIQRMRQAATGDDAFKTGEGLPMAVRLYTAGAVDFRAGNLASAAIRFQAILDLAPADRTSREVWATYMLGRIAAHQGDADKMVRFFAATRALVLQGAADPLGLAVTSYGEEAGFHFRKIGYSEIDEAETDGSSTDASSSLPVDAGLFGRESALAVRLYAEQAARKSLEGVDSLRIVARFLTSFDVDKDQLQAAVAYPLVQRLLVAYVLAYEPYGPARNEPVGAKDARTSDATNLLQTLYDAMDAHHKADLPPGFDRLAVLAYRMGNYALAEAIVDRTAGPLAAWVKAKLALQKGDLAAAAGFYADAAKAFAPAGQPGPLDAANARRMVGESGVVALARGDYIDAFDKLYAVGDRYWGDVAYVAERVLTVDELKSFVDRKVPARADNDLRLGWIGRNNARAAELRDLLGRRLVREARYAEALGYFQKFHDFSGHEVDPAAEVSAYAAALQRAASAWGRTRKAQGWYDAAVIVRKSGMEMMGYETAPDLYAIWGDFPNWVGQSKVVPGPYVTPDELRRFAASKAVPPWRFHYRFIAAEEAARAADLLPPRSQAFAAVLCHATEWTGAGKDTTVGADASTLAISQGFYARYVKEGAPMPWAAHFGHDCPEPDFDEADRLIWK